MESVINATKKFYRLFIHKDVRSKTDYNNQLFAVKTFIKDAGWGVVKDMAEERKKMTDDMLRLAKSNDERNIAYGRRLEIDSFISALESKARRPYVEEFNEEET